jgi:hypothetical protein
LDLAGKLHGGIDHIGRRTQQGGFIPVFHRIIHGFFLLLVMGQRTTAQWGAMTAPV